ncbi:hypothetical protein Avbf_17828 [Armadillidium vulgare]|nr:hypothetical protein Avbf_17828 [Armadillidium vulgare]
MSSLNHLLKKAYTLNVLDNLLSYDSVLGRKSTLPLVTLLSILSPFINGRGLVSRHSSQVGISYCNL